MASQAFLEKAYLAYFGRPVDPVGLFAFKDSTEAQVYTAFFESAESRSLYGDGFGTTQINAVYQMLFGRDAEPAGIAYWANQITLGLLTPASAALGILNGAKNTDAVAVTNKLAASKAYTASLDTLAESSAYVGDGAAAFARDFLKSVSTFPATQSQVDTAIKGLVNLGGTSFIGTDHVFTLQESVVAGEKATAGKTVVYWGYNPHGHNESGVDNTVAGTTGTSNTNNITNASTTNLTNEGPTDGGIPVADLVSFLTTITGLDLKELGLVDANGVDPFQNVTSLSLSNPLSSGANTTGTTTGDGNSPNSSNTLTISFADGTSLNAEVKLGDAYFKFLHDLLFDAQGNSRLYEKVIGATSGSADKLQPIRLTPYENNGGTIETGTVTTSGNDLIVAGRLELLHQAYIDGGAGTNILEIDAKGTYAQPASLKNIQEIRVNDLPNWYTTGNGFTPSGTSITNSNAGGNLNNTAFNANGFLSPTGLGSDDSWLDLNRAVDIKKLVVTDGSNLAAAGGSGSTDDYSGNLTIVGVRNGALLRLEGGFKSGSTTIQYGQGQTGTLNVELAVGDVTANINILQNAAVLNIDSTGVVNHLHNFFGGGSVSRMIVKGTGEFAVDENISSSFNQNAAVLIDASANTGGLNINFDASGGSDVNAGTNVASRFASVTVKGTTVDDVVMVQNVKAYTPDQVAAVNGATTSTNMLNGKVTIDVGNGDNSVVTDGSDIVKVTTGTGDDTIMAKNGQVVTIVAGDGANVVNADSATLGLAVVTITTGAGTDNISAKNGKVVTIVAGDGNNLITADGSETVAVTTGTGNDKISAVGEAVKTVVIDAGAGNNTIAAQASVSVNITTGAGNDKITAVGNDITISSGGGTDAIVLSGTYAEDGVTAQDGAMLNINTGATGSATITFGNDQVAGATPAYNDNLAGVTALDGSVIAGNNVKLYIDSATNLTQADLTGLLGTTKVVVENGDILRITSDQFKALGAAAFSAFLSGAGAQTGDVYILLKAGTSFDLASVADLASLSANVKLHFELQEASNLTLTAEQLHKYLANDAITSVSGTNGDGATAPNGIVTLKAVGNSFDWTADADPSRIWGTITEANVDNLIVTRDSTGYNRPTDVVTTDVYTIDSVGTDPLVVGSVTTEAMTFKLTGTQAINFTGVVDLGGDALATVAGDDILAGHKVAGATVIGTAETDAFVVDFSTLTAKVTGLTLNHFQDVKSIKGNGIAGTRIDVMLNADVGTAGTGKGLVTSGVDTYMVTMVDLNQDGAPDNSGEVWFNLCDASQDVKFVGLKGNAGSTLVIKDVPWGKVAPHIVLEGDGYANANEALKVDLSPNFSDVGSVTAEYNSGGAFAVVDINNGGVELGTTATGAERKFKVGTVTLTGATSATVNVAQGDATIEALAGSTLASVKFVATEDVTVTTSLPALLKTIDASGVTGAFKATLVDPVDHALIVTGGAGLLDLTLNGVNPTLATEAGSSITGGTGLAKLTVTAASDLSKMTLTNVDKVVVENGIAVTLTLAQVAAIVVTDITTSGATGTLNLVGLDNTPFSVANLTAGMSIGTVTLAANPVITLDPTTNLTGVATLVVPDGTTLNLTAAQFQQLGLHTISGSGTAGLMGTVNITDLKQSDIKPLDLNGDGDYADAGEHAGFTLAGITGVKMGTVTMAESVTLKATDSFGTFTKIVMGNDQTLALSELFQANGLKITGGTNTVLQILDTNTTAPVIGGKIDASGFTGVTTLKMLNVLVANGNVDFIFDHLPASVVKEIYNDLGWVSLINQIVTVDAGTTVPGSLTFNPITNDTELQNFTLNLSGGTEITGALNVATTPKVVSLANQMRTHLDTLTINSTGTAANTNLLNGKTANVIKGDITPMAAPGNADSVAVAGVTNNNLLKVVVNAAQDLTVTGSVVFSSVVGDDTFTGNDNDAAVATLTVNGTANVTVGAVDTSDDDVDGLTVVNNSTGTLSLTLDAAKLDQVTTAPANNDALSFTGSKIALTVVDSAGAVDTVNLSDDNLAGVSKITLGNGLTAGGLGGELTLTHAQYNTLGGANLVDDGLTANSAVLRLVDFGSAPFNATTVGANITLASITIAAGTVTLDPTTNLTKVAAIFVQEGSTLNLTAAQFQQLSGKGTITGLDTNGNGTIGTFTVNITDLKQADVEHASAFTGDTAGFDVTGITGGTIVGLVNNAPKVNITLADSTVAMGKYDAAGALTLPSVLGADANQVTKFILADNQTLAFVNSTQADGRAVTGGTNSTIVMKFAAMDVTDADNQIEAAGYSVTTLKALATFVDGENVEFLLKNVASSIQERYYTDPLQLGLVLATNRVVVVEAGVNVNGYLMYNDLQTTQEVRTLDLTLSGGSKITGDLNLSTTTKVNAPTLTQQYFDTLTIHSSGAAANAITGNITAAPTADNNGTSGLPQTIASIENNLLKVAIDASQPLVVGVYNTDGSHSAGGNIVFTSVTDAANAELTITGTASVKVHGLDATDDDVNGVGTPAPDINTLTVTNNSTGAFTVTGGTAAITGSIENLVLKGTGAMAFGTNAPAGVVNAEGLTSSTISSIDASGLSGALSMGIVDNVDSNAFAFKAGTGTTTLTLTTDKLDAPVAGGLGATKTATWTFDFSNAGANSEFHLKDVTADAYGNAIDLADLYTSNVLNINLGANTTLYIDENTDFTKLDSLTLTQTKNIVLADGKTLTLTAAQANTLKIVAGPDTGATGITAKVNIIDLSTAPVDFSGIATNIAGTVTLKQSDTATHAADVTLDAATNLGDFTVVLESLTLSDILLTGQTVRFTTVAQADNAVSVIGNTGSSPVTDGNLAADTGANSSNVVWLFNSMTSPIDTAKYDPELGRLLFSAALVNSFGGLVENMFTTLNSTILRVDFASVAQLNILLSSKVVDRVMEFSNFTTVGNLTYSDIGLSPVEHLHSLQMVLGGQVTVGNVLIDDVIPATGYNPIGSDQFTALTIDSKLALTGRAASFDPDGTGPVAPILTTNQNYLASEAYVNNNDGTNATGETAQPNNINTVGNIGVGAANGLDLLTVNLNTFGLSVAGNSSAGDGAKLKLGSITFGTVLPASTAVLNVTGANNIDATSVITTDADITALTVNAGGFTGVLTAPGASPAINMGTAKTLTFSNATLASPLGVGNATTLTVTPDAADNNNEKVTVSYVLDGVAATKEVDLSGVNVLVAADVATAIAAQLMGVAAIAAGATVTAFAGVVTATATGAHTLSITSVALSAGAATTLGAAITYTGGVINLGSATKAGVAGSQLTTLNASAFDGILNLGTLSMMDSTNNDDLTTIPVDTSLKAFTFTSGQGITTATLAALDGATPTLNTGSEWLFDYTGAKAGSYLKITPSVVFQVDSKLTLTNVPVVIEGAVNLTAMVNNVTTPLFNEGLNMTGGSIEVLAGSVLTLTVAQVRALQALPIQIFGAGTIKVVGDDSNPTVPGADTPLGANLMVANVDLSGVTLIASPTFGFDTDTTVKLTVVDANIGLAGVPVAGSHVITGSANNDLINLSSGASHTMSHTVKVTAGTDTIVGLQGDTALSGGLVHDVLVVSATATALATLAAGVNFVATAATMNDGTATISAANNVGVNPLTPGVVDMSLAGGTKGFTLTGGTSGTQGLDTLIGSAKNDMINGGNSVTSAAGTMDTLRGNGGQDTFLFNTTTTTPATLSSVVTTQGLDREILTVTAAGVDGAGDAITITYTMNNIVNAVVILNSTVGNDFFTVAGIATAVATALNGVGGFSAAVDGVTPGQVNLVGLLGNKVTINPAFAMVGTQTMTTANGPVGFPDVAHQTTMTVAGAAPSAGERYNLTVTLKDGTQITADEHIAVVGETSTMLAAAIVNNFNTISLLNGNPVTAVATTAGVFTLTDNTPNDGAFTITTFAGAGTFGGSGSSGNHVVMAGAANASDAFADVIQDFTAVDDSISFVNALGVSLGAGSGTNFSSGAGVATFALALAAADTAMNGTVIYYVASVNETAPGAGNGYGVLFFDANTDGTADGVVQLTGITAASMTFLDIV